MLKKIFCQIAKGLTIGVGFGLSLIAIVYIIDQFKLFENNNYQEAQDDRQVQVIERVIKNLPKNTTDACKHIVGQWHGSKTYDNGSEIQNWEVTYHEDGKFEGEITSKTITKEEVEKQKGAWRCENSLLINDLIINNDKNRKYTYLILHINEDERTYVNLDSSGFRYVFTSYKRKGL